MAAPLSSDSDPSAAHATPSPPGLRRARDWRRAWRAVRKLAADSSRTDLVFEILEALGGPTDEASFRAFVAETEGRRQLSERSSLLDFLSDHDALARLPDGSFGRAYLAFMQQANLNAHDLVDAEAEGAGSSSLDPDRRWVADRGRDSHDLWHVLTGYGRDEAGEAALLAFTYASYPNPGIALILFVAALIGPKTPTFEWERYLLEAYRRGRAADLDFARYEEWLPLPLDRVRALARIQRPEEAHPRTGIVGASREGGTGLAFGMRG